MKEDPDAIKNNEKSVRTPRIGTQTRQRQLNRGRSVSPKRIPVQRLNDDDDDDDDTDSDSEDVWEEVEDELGNVFYYNERTNRTQTTFPVRKTLDRQERLQQLQ